VHKRSGVARKPVVPPAQLSKGQSLWRALSASLHKDGTWRTTKQFLRGDSSLVASALCHLRANCSLGSMSPQRLAIVKHCDRVALQVAVLSGFPTSATSLFSQCPISGPSPFAMARHRRPRHIPLAREDIPDNISHLTSSILPPGPDVIPNFGF